jgi:hypothetical protein
MIVYLSGICMAAVFVALIDFKQAKIIVDLQARGLTA